MFLLFFTDNNESCESLWNRVCVKEPDGLREEALPQSLCLCLWFIGSGARFQ